MSHVRAGAGGLFATCAFAARFIARGYLAPRAFAHRGPAWAALALVVVASACRSATVFGREAVWPTPKKGAVVSEHPLATQVGLEILDAGGNAADAAVATALALAVVYPQAGNLGGGGFALYVPHSGVARAFDFRETAPAAAKSELYLDGRGRFVPDRSLVGPLSVAVPGSPAGLAALLEKSGSGRFSLAQLCEPAIEFARKGFEVDAWLARDLVAEGLRESMNAPARALFYPGGRPLKVGDRLVQPDLARTLTVIAEKGANGFYRGALTDLIVREIERGRIPRGDLGGAIGDGSGSGWITREDLASYTVKERAPLKGWFRGLEIVTMPPPSSGGIVLVQALGMLEGLPLSTDRNETLAAHGIEKEKGASTSTDTPGLSERMVHWWIESLRAAFADRAETMGDPDFVSVPIAALTSPAWIAQRRIEIGESARVDVEPWHPPAREGGETTHVSVLDDEGNACSLTTTLNTTFGSKTMVEGAGFFLNDEMDDFAIQAGTPNGFGLVGGTANAIQPSKRPLSSMTPTVLRDGGHANVMVIGSPGGPRIITAVFQVLLRVLVLEQSFADAVRAPRLHQQWSPKETLFEKGFDPTIVGALVNRRGHPVSFAKGSFASVQVVALDAVGGEPITVSDPRRGGNGATQGRSPSKPALPTESSMEGP
ncbi:MAG: gamma-glutamyltransferase family protein [Planctomycetota bacterium]|nr:gamma-glutamyltransferase family protein [Planctomycetota bacterium]